MVYPIAEKRNLTETVCLMRVYAPETAEKALAGQFVIVRANSRSERIPLTVVACDKVAGLVTIVFQIVGAATMTLASLHEGDGICDFTGPLGNPTDLEGVKRALVVGGGVGCAIALPIAAQLHASGAEVISVIGFRSASHIIFEEEFRAQSKQVFLVTDDGSRGEKGNVCLPIERLLQGGAAFDRAFVVGPLPMMKFASRATLPYGLKTIASMNPIMIDGTGMCGCCRVTVGGEMKFACVDGPDFDAHSIDFDEAIARAGMYAPFEAAARERHCNLFGRKGQ